MTSLVRDRIGQWNRADGSKAAEYMMRVDDLVVDTSQLREVVNEGMRITIFSGSAPKATTSLSFLAPVIDDVRDLWIGTVNQIIDVEVLNRARNLRSLSFTTGPCDGRLELSTLPYLEEFEGKVTRVVSSVLRNPSLRFLKIEGKIPNADLRIAGPVEVFEQRGARSQIELPTFAHPEALRALSRLGSASFDLNQLAGMTGLGELTLMSSELSGVTELAKLERLERLTLGGRLTTGSWDDLPMVPWGRLEDVRPVPSKKFLAERRRAGWWVPDDPVESRNEALTIEAAGEVAAGHWGVFMSRFDALGEAVELFDDSTPGGIHGEYFLLGVVAELRGQMVDLAAEADSEGDFTAVYFRDRAQAELVYARAKELLSADPATQLAYLRAGC